MHMSENYEAKFFIEVVSEEGKKEMRLKRVKLNLFRIA